MKPNRLYSLSFNLSFYVAYFVILSETLLDGCFVCLSPQVETIRRAKSIVGEEVVDIEYRVFEGLAMVSAEDVVDTMNRLSEAEFVVTLKYAVGVIHLLAFLFNGNLCFCRYIYCLLFLFVLLVFLCCLLICVFVVVVVAFFSGRGTMLIAIYCSTLW